MSDRIGVMSGGRILQIGSPRQIYAHPSNRFVADFIGETNFLSATVRGGTAHLPGGIKFALPQPKADGTATLAVRPEHLRLVPQGMAGSLSATVSHSIYFGTDSHVHLRLLDGTEVVARQQTSAEGASGPEPGAIVGVAFSPGAVQVLED